MKIYLFLFIFTIKLVHASPHHGHDVVVGVSPGYPVYYYDAASQSFRGSMVDSFRAICKEAGLNCIFRSLPKKRIEKELVHGSIHLGSVINTASQMAVLEENVYFTQFNIPARVGMYSTLPLDQIPTELEGYYGKGIICVRGWTLSILPGIWEAEKHNKLNISQTTSIEAATKMLLAGRAPFLYSNKDKMDVFFSEDDEVYFKPFRSFNQTFAISKAADNYEAIKSKLDGAISRLIENGVLNPDTGKLN